MIEQRYKLSQLAQEHLHKIKSYTTDNYSKSQWQSYKTKLLTGFQMLANNPKVARSCDEIYPNGYYFPVGQHLAYFVKEDGFILIVAVLGRTQLPQNHLHRHPS